MTTRLLADSPAVLLIVYTPGPGAEAGGYEAWLREVDNPFFNAIPGVHHYANWRIERVLHGAAPGYGWFDFQGLVDASDLERVWFNPDLDRFRSEWIRRWGYGAGVPHPAQGYAFLMQPAGPAGGVPRDHALVTAGIGDPPPATDRCWRVVETIRKHFAPSDGGTSGPGGGWRMAAATHNPLGFDWLAVTYGRDAETLGAGYKRGPDMLAFVARLVAAP